MTNYSTLRAEGPREGRRRVRGSEGPLLARAAVLAASGNNEAVLNHLQHRHAILPVDFWNPVEFTLDPELSFLHPQHHL